MIRCSKCLLPETHETITFDVNGVCSVCNNRIFRDNGIDWNKRKKELLNLVNGTKKNADYDCVVPFSGGKDSTFTLLYAVRELELRPLVVSFDHGFFRPNLIENRRKTLEKLGVDSLIFTPNWKLVRKLMLQSLLDKGDFCWHCHTGIFAYPMWVALEKKIPLVLWGEPSSEYTSYYSYADKEQVDEDRFNQINTLGISADDMFYRLNQEFDLRDFKPFTYPSRQQLSDADIISIPLGSFIPWDTKSQGELISAELGWMGDEVEGVPSEYYYEKIECFMQGVRDYIKFRKRGYSRPSHLVSLDIRSGRKTRIEAQSIVDEFEGRRPASLDLFLEFLALTEKEFDEIVDKHVVDPWDNSVPVRIGKKPKDFDLWPRKTPIDHPE